MYCINCGVELADSETVCPLCGTRVFHPDMPRQQGEPPFPPDPMGHPEEVNRSGALFILTMLAVLPIVICILCDWSVNGAILWSGYAAGGVALLYILAVLPLWFRKPNPVIFVPADFVAIGLYLLYINFATGGHWFLTFALPVTGTIGVLVTTVVTLPGAPVYLRRGADSRRRPGGAHRVPAEPDLRAASHVHLVLLSLGGGGAAGGHAADHCRVQAPAPVPAPEVFPVRPWARCAHPAWSW